MCDNGMITVVLQRCPDQQFYFSTCKKTCFFSIDCKNDHYHSLSINIAIAIAIAIAIVITLLLFTFCQVLLILLWKAF